MKQILVKNSYWNLSYWQVNLNLNKYSALAVFTFSLQTSTAWHYSAVNCYRPAQLQLQCLFSLVTLVKVRLGWDMIGLQYPSGQFQFSGGISAPDF